MAFPQLRESETRRERNSTGERGKERRGEERRREEKRSEEKRTEEKGTEEKRRDEKRRDRDTEIQLGKKGEKGRMR